MVDQTKIRPKPEKSKKKKKKKKNEAVIIIHTNYYEAIPCLIIISSLQFNDFLHMYRDSFYPVFDLLLGKLEQKVEEVSS